MYTENDCILENQENGKREILKLGIVSMQFYSQF